VSEQQQEKRQEKTSGERKRQTKLAPTGESENRIAQEGDPSAPAGTQEHLGSERPYEGASAEPKSRDDG
jgi:hypothetical protein